MTPETLQKLNELQPKQIAKVEKLITKLHAKLTTVKTDSKPVKVVAKVPKKATSPARIAPSKNRDKATARANKEKGMAARCLGQVQVGPRHNAFDDLVKSGKIDLHKKDSVIDKKLVNGITARGERDSGLVQVECIECGREDIVASSTVYSDSDGVRYKCNNCSKQGSRE